MQWNEDEFSEFKGKFPEFDPDNKLKWEKYSKPIIAELKVFAKSSGLFGSLSSPEVYLRFINYFTKETDQQNPLIGTTPDPETARRFIENSFRTRKGSVWLLKVYYWFHLTNKSFTCPTDLESNIKYVELIEKEIFGDGKTYELLYGKVPGKEAYQQSKRLAAASKTDAEKKQRIVLETQVSIDVELLLGKLQGEIFGRTDQLKKIDNFVVNNDNGLLILSGPSGTGKSTLLAKWLDQWMGVFPDDQLIFHFFSSQYPTTINTANALENIARSLKYYRKDEVELPQNQNKLGDVILNTLNVKPKNGSRTIVVLDALDEAVSEIIPFIRPSYLASNVFVIVSARVENVNKTIMPEYLREWDDLLEEGIEGEHWTIPPLDINGIKDWIKTDLKLISDESVSKLAQILFSATDGFPLFLNFVIDDLKKRYKPDSSIEEQLEFAQNLPNSINKYLARQLTFILKSNKALWTKTIKPLLATLSIIKGPISGIELEKIHSDHYRDIDALDQSVTRWIWSFKGSYSFLHPKLRQAFSYVVGLAEDEAHEELSEISYTAWEAEDKLIEWMETVWPPHNRKRENRAIKQYALDWLPQHLIDLDEDNRQEAGVKLISNWLFLIEQSLDQQHVVNRLEKSFNQWTSLPITLKDNDRGKVWSSFVATNETALIKQTKVNLGLGISSKQLLLRCLRDAMLADEIKFSGKSTLPKFNGVWRTVNNIKIIGVEKLDDCLISWTEKGSILFWGKNGEIIQTKGNKKAHSGKVLGLLPFGDGFVSWGKDSKILISDNDGKPLKDIDTRSYNSGAICGLTEINGQLVSFDEESNVYIWSVGENIELKNSLANINDTKIVGILKYKNFVVTWCAGGELQLRDQEGNHLHPRLSVNTIFDIDQVGVFGKYLITSHRNKGVRLWANVENLIVSVASFNPHLIATLGIKIIDDKMLSWGYGDEISVWHPDCEPTKVNVENSPLIDGFAKFGGGLISWGNGQELTVWNNEYVPILTNINFHSHSADIAGVFEFDRKVVTWDKNGSISFCDLFSYDELKEQKLSNTIDFIETDDFIVTCHRNGLINFWNFEGNILQTMRIGKAHNNKVNGIRLIKHGIFVTWGGNDTMILWLPNGEHIKCLDVDLAHKHGVAGVLDIENGFVTWGGSGRLCFWNYQGIQQSNFMEESPEGSYISHLHQYPGGFVGGGQDGCVKFWDQKGILHTNKGLDESEVNWTYGIIQSKNYFISWGMDKNIRLFDKQGQYLKDREVTNPHNGSVKGVMEYGERIISWGENGFKFLDLEGQIMEQDAIKGNYDGFIITLLAYPNGFISLDSLGIINFWGENFNLRDTIIPPDSVTKIHLSSQNQDRLYAVGKHLWFYDLNKNGLPIDPDESNTIH